VRGVAAVGAQSLILDDNATDSVVVVDEEEHEDAVLPSDGEMVEADRSVLYHYLQPCAGMPTLLAHFDIDRRFFQTASIISRLCGLNDQPHP
jgi:hypothetical protein